MNLQRVNSEVGLLESDLELPNKHMPPWPMTVERADICMWRYVYGVRALPHYEAGHFIVNANVFGDILVETIIMKIWRG